MSAITPRGIVSWAFALFLAAIALTAQADHISAQILAIVGTPHDFRGENEGPGLGKGFQGACGYCHAPPRKPGDDEGPRRNAWGSRPLRGSPSGPSALCLSCHDGTTANDVADETAWKDAGHYSEGEHPVSVRYDEFDYQEFHTVQEIRREGLELYGTQGEYRVECVTCHDPHDNRLGNFLRMSNDGSALCLACHVR